MRADDTKPAPKPAPKAKPVPQRSYTQAPLGSYTNFGVTPHGMTPQNPGGRAGHDAILFRSQNFGLPIKSQQGEAVDLFAPAGSPVAAPFSGTVVYSKQHSHGGYGSYAILRSADGRLTAVLGHLEQSVRPGTRYAVGETIGHLYPLRNGAHLHFELAVDGNVVSAGPGASSKDIYAQQQGVLGKYRPNTTDQYFTPSDPEQHHTAGSFGASGPMSQPADPNGSLAMTTPPLTDGVPSDPSFGNEDPFGIAAAVADALGLHDDHALQVADSVSLAQGRLSELMKPSKMEVGNGVH